MSGQDRSLQTVEMSIGGRRQRLQASFDKQEGHVQDKLQGPYILTKKHNDVQAVESQSHTGPGGSRQQAIRVWGCVYQAVYAAAH